MFGLHPNAEIGYLTNWTVAIFDTMLSLGGGGEKAGATGSSSAKETMDYFLRTLPEPFQMITIQDNAKPFLLLGMYCRL
jgi:dynein heavy chain